MGFAGKVTQLANERYPDTPPRWGMQVGGTVGVLHWTVTFRTWPASRGSSRRSRWTLSTPGWSTSAEGAFVPGRTHDAIVSLIG
jgi:hypothetical protein